LARSEAIVVENSPLVIEAAILVSGLN
jgi:hypothetical protein